MNGPGILYERLQKNLGLTSEQIVLVKDIIYVPQFMELLGIPLNPEEPYSVLAMIGRRLRLVYHLFAGLEIGRNSAMQIATTYFSIFQNIRGMYPYLLGDEPRVSSYSVGEEGKRKELKTEIIFTVGRKVPIYKIVIDTCSVQVSMMGFVQTSEPIIEIVERIDFAQ